MSECEAEFSPEECGAELSECGAEVGAGMNGAELSESSSMDLILEAL